MADTALYSMVATARRRQWDIKIFRKGYTGATTQLLSGREMRIAWGRQTNGFDSRVRASELWFDILDPDLLVYNSMSDSSYDESDWYITFVGSLGEYSMTMRVRLDEMETLYSSRIRSRVTRVYCYCGMADMREIDAITATSSTFGSLIAECLISNGISQDIDVLSQHYANNIASSGVVWDLMRLNRLDLIYVDDGRKAHNMYDQLKGFMEGMGLTVMNTMHDKWVVMHEYATGETLSGLRGAMRYAVSPGSFTTLNTWQGYRYEIHESLGNVRSGMTRRPIRPVQAVEQNRGNKASDKFVTVDLIRFGGFEDGWTSDSAHSSWLSYDATPFRRSTDSDTGTYAMAITPNAGVVQNLVRLAGGQNLDFEVTARVAMREQSASAGSSRQFQLLFRLWNTVLDGTTPVAWGDPEGWEDSINVLLFTTDSVGAASSLIYSTIVTMFRGPIPDEEGYAELTIFNTNTTKELFIDSVEVRLKKGDDPLAQFVGVNARYGLETVSPFNSFRIGTGEVVEQSVQWMNAFMGLDPDGDGDRDEIVPMMQALTSASGSWVDFGDWVSEVNGYNSQAYSDILDLAGSIRIAQQSSTIEQIECELLDIVPPYYAIGLDQRDYTQIFTDIDLIRETTRSIANRKIINSSTITTARYIYWGDNSQRVRRAEVDPANTPWTADTLFTLPGTYNLIVAVHIDELANGGRGYAFVLARLAAGGRHLLRLDLLDGGNLTVIYDDTQSYLLSMDIARNSQSIYFCLDRTGGTATYSIVKYDYEGNSLGTVKYEPTGDKAQWIAVNEAETILYYRHYRTNGFGADEDEVRAHLLADGTETDLGSTAFDNSGEISRAVVDAQQGKIFSNGEIGGTDFKIVHRPLTPSTETDWITAGNNIESIGLAVDHLRQKGIYIVEGGGEEDIYWASLGDPSDAQVVYRSPNGTGDSIIDICTGYN